MLSSPKCL